jgi:hypothetical protein
MLYEKEMNRGEVREILRYACAAVCGAATRSDAQLLVVLIQARDAATNSKILTHSYPSLSHCTNPTLCTRKSFRIDSAYAESFYPCRIEKGQYERMTKM